jgi:hypothetical protein
MRKSTLKNHRNISSSELHNRNCYLYLKTLRPFVTDYILSILPPGISAKLIEFGQENTYHPNSIYGDVYQDLISFLEDNLTRLISDLKKNNQKSFVNSLMKEINEFIISLYDNDNNILEHTFSHIKHIPLNHRPVSGHIEKSVSDLLSDRQRDPKHRFKSPAEANSNASRFQSIVSPNFKPQQETNIPTRRKYRYSANYPITEIRIGTQGQRNKGDVRINPLFELFLTAQRTRFGENKITHVYFNNLALDRFPPDIQGLQERQLSLKLHALENHHKNIAVITLPADEGLMNKEDYTCIHSKLSYDEVYDQFLGIASQDAKFAGEKNDFYISPIIRKHLFGTKANEIYQLQQLLNQSFAVMGIQAGQPLSYAQRQAVWFHFIKFELSNYILSTLQPNYINFSCKDAIDRGGVSSAYFNLLKSIEFNQPLTREEFECALHAAPAMVKARGINHHLNVIWNAVDANIEANYANLIQSEASWLVSWRDANCPHERVSDLLSRRIAQVRERLTNSTLSTRKIQAGLAVLNEVETQVEQGVSGKRLLLEVVSKQEEAILNPNEETKDQYIELADELEIKYPKLQILAGLMKMFVGILLFIPTAGYSKMWITSGWATTKAGYNAATRNALQQQIRHDVDEESPILSSSSVSL